MTDLTNELIVSEIFGFTVQGEGPSLGKRCLFLRLGTCNLQCSFCDTKYSWDWVNYDPSKETRRMSIDVVAAELNSHRSQQDPRNPHYNDYRLVITGGEPLLQQAKVARLIEQLKAENLWIVEVETAGTIIPTYRLDQQVNQFNVSPKLSNSGNTLERRYRPDVLRFFRNRKDAFFKYVVRSSEDLDEVDVQVLEIGIPRPRVYIMPEGETPDALIKHTIAIADDTIARGYNLTTRLHILAWKGDRKR